MARRIAGEDPLELREALLALGEVDDLTGMEAFVHDRPIVLSPAFAERMQQDYVRVRNEHPEYLASLREPYYDLFRLLHHRAYSERCRGVREERPPPVVPSSGPAMPALHARVLEILDGRVPPFSGPPVDPSRDVDRLREEVSAFAGEAVDLPAYIRSPGIGWTMVGVRCPRCEHDYLSVRPHFVDLVAAPELADALLAGQLECPGCPRCGEVCAHPLGVFLEDPPFAGDPLASLSCACRVGPKLLVYRPPPGTEQCADWDHVLQARFGLRLEDLGWLNERPNRVEEDEKAKLGAAYTPEQMRTYVEARGDDGDVPLDMMWAIEGTARKLRDGTLSIHEAEKQISDEYRRFAGRWSIMPPPHPDASGGYPYEGLVRAMLAETLAEAGGESEAFRTVLAAVTATYYVALNEPAAAERALSRATDLQAEVSVDDPGRPAVEETVRSCRAELLYLQGRPDEAERVRSNLGVDRDEDPHTITGRAATAARREEAALLAFERGRLAAALEAYPACVGELRALVADIEAADTPEALRVIDSVRHNLCAAIANYGGTLQAAANDVEAATRHHGGASPDEISADLGVDVSVSLARVEEMRPVLRHMFPGGFLPDHLREVATRLLHEALEIAESIRAWDFAARQTLRLALLAHEPGDEREALAHTERLREFAERAGDHLLAGSAKATLAADRLAAGDGEAALGLLQGYVREWTRERIGRGHRVGAAPEVAVYGEKILKTVEVGADPTKAVVTLENFKAVTTGSTLATGFPVRPVADEPSGLARRVDEVARTREKRRLELIWSPNDPELRSALEQAEHDLVELRKELSLRDPKFAEWVDASDVELSDEKAFVRRLVRLGPGTRFLGLFATHDSIST